MRTHVARILGLLLPVVILGGCETVAVDVTGPQGTKLAIGSPVNAGSNTAQVALPATVKLSVPSQFLNQNQGSVLRAPVEIDFPSVRATGVIETYEYLPSDADRLSTNKLAITDAEVQRVVDGDALILTGQSASGSVIYKITVGKQK